MFLAYPWDAGEKPVFINNKGIEWYDEKSLNQACFSEHLDAPAAKDIKIYVTRKGQDVNYVMIKGDKAIDDSRGYEAMLFKIDAYRLNLTENVGV